MNIPEAQFANKIYMKNTYPEQKTPIIYISEQLTESKDFSSYSKGTTDGADSST